MWTRSLSTPFFQATLSSGNNLNNAALTEEQMPKQTKNPWTQLLRGPSITPPPPAGPRLPREAPSAFNLTHPSDGANHRIKSINQSDLFWASALVCSVKAFQVSAHFFRIWGFVGVETELSKHTLLYVVSKSTRPSWRITQSMNQPFPLPNLDFESAKLSKEQQRSLLNC